MKVEPQQEHHWLNRLVGDWSYENEAVMGPDQPPIKSQGTQSTHSIGGLWIECVGKGNMPDGNPATMIITLGFDPVKKRFVGTFIGSMMTHLWVYDGALAGNVLTLEAEGPSMQDPHSMAKYQDIIELVSDDHYILSSQILAPDGRWIPFMTAHYRRMS